MNLYLTNCIEAKIKQAEDNIKKSYQQYLEDIEGIKKLMPEEKRHLVEDLAQETDSLHEQILCFVEIYLRTYVTAHIRSLLVLDKIAANSNVFPTANRQNANF